jgi:hypothetical protein
LTPRLRPTRTQTPRAQAEAAAVVAVVEAAVVVAVVVAAVEVVVAAVEVVVAAVEALITQPGTPARLQVVVAGWRRPSGRRGSPR